MDIVHRSQRQAKRDVAALAAAACGAWGAPAPAAVDHYYHWREPNGTAVFSGVTPPPSVGHYELRDIRTWSLIRPRPPGTAAPTVEEEDLRSGVADDLAATRETVGQARQAQALGREPLPGERQRLVNGYSRLRPSYFDRQRELDDDVQEAEQDLRVCARESDGQNAKVVSSKADGINTDSGSAGSRARTCCPATFGNGWIRHLIRRAQHPLSGRPTCDASGR